MTVMLEKGKSFMSMPMLKVRNILKAWRHGSSDPGDIAARKDVQDDPRNVIAVLSELEANGLTGIEAGEGVLSTWERYGLTDKGLALAGAAATKRIPRKTAERKFRGLLERAEKVNSDPYTARLVERIWLFGSLLDPEKSDVGDIDVVVESVRTGEFESLFEEGTGKAWDYLCRHYPDLMTDARSYLAYVASDSTVLHKMLFGPRRDPAFAPNDIDTLERLHEPCRLAFDRSRGGIVDDPILPHLPTSEKRDESMKPRLTLPDLVMSDKLSYARFLPNGPTPITTHGPELYSEFSQDDYEHGDFDGRSLGRAVVTPEDARELIEVITGAPPLENFDDVDGRGRFLVVFEREMRGRSWVRGWFSIRRSVETFRDDTLEDPPYDVRLAKCDVTPVELPGETFRPAEIEWVKEAVFAMVGADTKLLHERAKEAGEETNIVMSMRVNEDTESGRRLWDRLDGCSGWSHLPEREEDGTCWEIDTRERPELDEEEMAEQ